MVRLQTEIAEFRTPQHPSLGTNNWGGASPLLARNLPNESLEQRYQRLNSVRNDGEIFAAGPDFDAGDDDNDNFASFSRNEASKYVYGAPRRLSLVRKLARRAQWKNKKKNSATAMATVTLSSTPKRRKWFGRWDPKNRWPQDLLVHLYIIKCNATWAFTYSPITNT
nr:uncharacterized protein LOC109173481 [Ipomoea batatas]